MKNPRIIEIEWCTKCYTVTKIISPVSENIRSVCKCGNVEYGGQIDSPVEKWKEIKAVPLQDIRQMIDVWIELIDLGHEQEAVDRMKQELKKLERKHE